MAIDGSQFLKEFRSREPHLALLLEQMIDGINGTAKHIGVDPNGRVQAPAPLEKLEVNAANGDVHAVLTHNAEIGKNIRYFVEADTDPSFAQPHVFDLGSGRSLFTRLPAKDSDGNDLNWHFRAYPQYQGSDPAPPVNFGERLNPTPVAVGGTTQLTPMPSKGSGTALANGTQGGKGLGVVLTRAPIGPKIPEAPSAG